MLRGMTVLLLFVGLLALLVTGCGREEPAEQRSAPRMEVKDVEKEAETARIEVDKEAEEAKAQIEKEAEEAIEGVEKEADKMEKEAEEGVENAKDKVKGLLEE